MLRRLYFLFPSVTQAEQAVAELTDLGIGRRHMHSIARDGVDISVLPPSTLRQRSDTGARLEKLLWNLNLALFFLALGVFVASLILGAWLWSLGLLVFMAVAVLLGNYFASHIPRVHLDEHREALKHGEVLLLADIPRWRVREVESAIREHHPEVNVGGVGWTLEALGL